MVRNTDIKSGSLCPAVKAADIIGDKWVLLLLRELLLGTTRFCDFERALPRISPTILSGRLKRLEADGLIVRRKNTVNKTPEYRLTRRGRELGPIVEYMSKWGLRWARRRICDENLDVGSFMWDFHRTLNKQEFPNGETVICVQFSDVSVHKIWWVLVDGQSVGLCTDDPAKNVDIYIAAAFSDLVGVWMGDISVTQAIASETIFLTGERHLVHSVGAWFPRSTLAHIRPMRTIE